MYYNNKKHNTINKTQAQEEGFVVMLVTRISSGNSYMMELVINRLKKKYEKEVKFFIYSVEEFRSKYENEFKLRKTPTTFIMHNNELQHQFEGLISTEELENILLNKRPILTS